MKGETRASPTRRLPVTAIVASRNEAKELERCLRSLAFCDELIVIDLESTDATAAVAEAESARLVRHPLVPIAEYARVDVAPSARNDWLLLSDPDEEVPPALAAELARALPQLPDDVGLVWAPIRFVFRGKPLRGTIWGGENRRRFLAHRDRVELLPAVFGGTRLRDGYRLLELPFSDETAIRHNWVSGYRDWIEKHLRYLRLQPPQRAAAGEITGLRGVATTPWRSFRLCFFTKRGYLDRSRGFALSVLWALYSTASEVRLLQLNRPDGRVARDG